MLANTRFKQERSFQRNCESQSLSRPARARLSRSRSARLARVRASSSARNMIEGKESEIAVLPGRSLSRGARRRPLPLRAPSIPETA